MWSNHFMPHQVFCFCFCFVLFWFFFIMGVRTSAQSSWGDKNFKVLCPAFWCHTPWLQFWLIQVLMWLWLALWWAEIITLSVVRPVTSSEFCTIWGTVVVSRIHRIPQRLGAQWENCNINKHITDSTHYSSVYCSQGVLLSLRSWYCRDFKEQLQPWTAWVAQL